MLFQNILAAESVSLESYFFFPFATFFLFVFCHGEERHHFTVTIGKISLSESVSVVSYLIRFINHDFCSTIIVPKASISYRKFGHYQNKQIKLTG